MKRRLISEKVDLTCLQTRRERLKSAPYPRLKKRKVFKIVQGGDSLGFLKIQFVAKYQKNEGETLQRH